MARWCSQVRASRASWEDRSVTEPASANNFYSIQVHVTKLVIITTQCGAGYNNTMGIIYDCYNNTIGAIVNH